MKFCEALNCSFGLPWQLNSKNLVCSGARRSTGFDDDDKKLADIISSNNKMSVKFITAALKDIPHLSEVKNINLGITDYMEKRIQPDLYIVYLHPGNVTAIMHALAKQGIPVSIPPYSLLSVCGNIFSNTFTNDKVTLSFGCPESRKYGGIHKDEVVMGIPYNLTGVLLNTIDSKEIYQ